MSTTKAAAAKRSAGADDGKITLTLAHPIGPKYQGGLGLEVKDEDYGVGEEIQVYPQIGRAIINAGYAQVDPEDPGAVAKALGISDDEAALVVEQMAGENPVRPVVES